MIPQFKNGNRYHGFEQGPIRPPSEASSLLIRVTRNCPWNQCLFCPVYKNRKFSLRTVDEIKQDIQSAKQIADDIKALSEKLGYNGAVNDAVVSAIFNQPGTNTYYRNIAAWLYYQTDACFLHFQVPCAEDTMQAFRPGRPPAATGCGPRAPLATSSIPCSSRGPGSVARRAATSSSASTPPRATASSPPWSRDAVSISRNRAWARAGRPRARCSLPMTERLPRFGRDRKSC